MTRRKLGLIAVVAMLFGGAAQIAGVIPAGAAVKPVDCPSCFNADGSSEIAYPGESFTYRITVTGVTNPKLTSKRRWLPHGLTFVDDHNGTGIISGTPTSTKHKSVVGIYNPGIYAVSTGVKPKVSVYAVFSIIVCSLTAPQPPCPGSP
jgi:hypothetical protein